MSESLDLSKILLIIKKSRNLTLNKEIAELLNLSEQDFSNRKKRGTLIEPIVKWGVNENVNLNWLLTGKGEPYVTKSAEVVAYLDDPETAELMEMTKQIIQSNTIYGTSLKANILSFHQAMTGEEKYKALEKELEEVGCKHLVSIEEARIRHDDPPQKKEEILKHRAI